MQFDLEKAVLVIPLCTGYAFFTWRMCLWRSSESFCRRPWNLIVDCQSAYGRTGWAKRTDPPPMPSFYRFFFLNSEGPSGVSHYYWAEFLVVSLSNHVGTTPRLFIYSLGTVTHQWHKPQGIHSSILHSPEGDHPSENWLRSRCLTSVIVRELVLPFWHQPLTSFYRYAF